MFSSIILEGWLPSARSMVAAAIGSVTTTTFGIDLTDIVEYMCVNVCECECACECMCVDGKLPVTFSFRRKL